MKIAELIKQSSRPFYSLEFFPPREREQFPAFLQTAGRLSGLNPLFVSVTYGAGGGRQDNTLEIARGLKEECAYLPMPHLTCVGSDGERILSFLDELAESGVDNVLALRGDAPASASGDPYDWSSGQFGHASDLVEFIRERRPDFGLAVAGYPAPHPESPSFAQDRRFCAQKLAGADFMVTQLFFDAREYVDLLAAMRAAGVDKLVIPGILPIQSFESLRHVLSLCGANIPARLYIALEEANRKGGAEAVREAGLDFAVEQIKRLLDAGAPGIHLYTLNKAEMCLRLAEAVGGL
ncbi:methylenetetrahydrofolate reductase [Desulfovibrio sp. OttesenSCG-928-C14]|nr:methylenetetrahydrofolate reductase [Desulfovibrio sp. OttesenSCG-928-C14]